MTKNDRRRHLYSQANLQRALEITIGTGTVIKGFDEAVSNMKLGDKGRFVLPPHIGYGDAVKSAKNVALIGPLIMPLLCPGAVVVSDRALNFPEVEAMDLPEGVPDGLYFMQRRL